MTEYEDLLDEREDIKRQREAVVADIERMKAEISRLLASRSKKYTQRAAQLAPLRRENSDAIIAMDRRLSEIKRRLSEIGPSTFEQRFLKAARELLPDEMFERVQWRAKELAGQSIPAESSGGFKPKEFSLGASRPLPQHIQDLRKEPYIPGT